MTMTGTIYEVAGAGSGIRRSGAGLVLAVLLLAGFPGTTVTSDTGSIPRASAGTAERVSLGQTPRPAVKPAFAADTAVRPARGAAMAATGKLDPDALMGLDQGETRHILGIPAALEDVPPAKVWHYANNACSLKVFFFMDMSSRDFRALSYDVKSSENVPDVDHRCFAQLVAQAGNARHD